MTSTLNTPRPSTVGTWTAYKVTDPDTTPTPAWGALTDEERLAWVNGPRGVALLPAMEQVWPRLASWIATQFPGCHIKRTPSATSMSLIEHTLPWDRAAGRSHQYPTLSDTLGRLIAATTPMHRRELVATPGTRVLTLRQYDARLAYAAYLRHLPVIPADGVQMDTVPTYERYRQGRYRVRVTVPGDWQGIGIAPRPKASGMGWEWPTTPGETWEQWLDTTEVALLHKGEKPSDGGNGLMDWPYRILQRMLFAPEGPGNDPLKTGWLPTLCAKIEAIDADARRATPHMQASRLAIRCMLLHPVGMWHRSHNTREQFVPDGDELPDDFGELEDVAPAEGGHVARGRQELTAYQRRWRRVEWAAAIYARERVAVTRRALSLPLGTLAAIDADAVTVMDYDPGWPPDTGKVGAYRLKHERMASFPGLVIPQDVRSLNRLVEGEGAHHGA